MPYEPTDLRQMRATSLAVSQLAFGATETGARSDAISNRVLPGEMAAPMIRHSDGHVQAPIGDDAPSPA